MSETRLKISPSCDYRLQKFRIPFFIRQGKSNWCFH